MGPSDLASILTLLFALHGARSQMYQYPNPYGNYAYQPMNQQPGYPNQGYPIYYQPQGYQPYYYYPSNPYVPTGQQMNYAYPYVYYNNPGGQNGQYYYPAQDTESTSQGTTSKPEATTSKPEATTKDPFANVKTDIIDVDPEHFNYLMGYMNLQPNAPAPQVTRKTYRNPPYIVKVNSNSYNQTSVPNVIRKHDVQNKVYTFRKTYVITPENRGKVINLSFLNGVQVTTPPPEPLKEETTSNEDVTTTTESENPSNTTKKSRRFIDVPGSCPEGSRYVAGKCFKKFSLSVENDQSNPEGNTTDDTHVSKVQVSTNVTVKA